MPNWLPCPAVLLVLRVLRERPVPRRHPALQVPRLLLELLELLLLLAQRRSLRARRRKNRFDGQRKTEIVKSSFWIYLDLP